MIKLFGLDEGYKHKPLRPMPKVKVKNEWLDLDMVVKSMQHRPAEDKMQIYSQVSLSVSDKKNEEIPVNLYIENSPWEESNTSWCSIVSIHDLRKEKKRISEAYRHKLTYLPNQLQALQDLNKFYAQMHLDNKKLALILLNIDNFSQLRAIVGVEQTNTILNFRT